MTKAEQELYELIKAEQSLSTYKCKTDKEVTDAKIKKRDEVKPKKEIKKGKSNA